MESEGYEREKIWTKMVRSKHWWNFLGIFWEFWDHCFLSYMGWVVAFERQTEERESVRFGSSMFMRQWGTRSSVQTSGLENDRIRTFGFGKIRFVHRLTSSLSAAIQNFEEANEFLPRKSSFDKRPKKKKKQW